LQGLAWRKDTLKNPERSGVLCKGSRRSLDPSPIRWIPLRSGPGFQWSPCTSDIARILDEFPIPSLVQRPPTPCMHRQLCELVARNGDTDCSPFLDYRPIFFSLLGFSSPGFSSPPSVYFFFIPPPSRFHGHQRTWPLHVFFCCY